MAFLDSLLAILGGGARGYAGRRATREASAQKQDELNREYGFKNQQLGLDQKQLDELAKYHTDQLGMDQKQLDELAKYHADAISAERYKADQESNRAMAELRFRALHPELQGGHSMTPDEMKLKLITDVYGTPQLGVTQDSMDQAYRQAQIRAQQAGIPGFGDYQAPPDPVQTFLHGYTTQDEVSNALKQLRQTNPVLWTQIGPSVAEYTRGWPKHKKAAPVFGPPMQAQPTPSIPGNYRPR